MATMPAARLPEASPGKPPGEAPRLSAPEPETGASRRKRIVAGLLSSTAGLAALVSLTAAYAFPESLPFMAPVAVALGAFALWGTARMDTMRIAAERDTLDAENSRLTASVEALADKAWEMRESEERYRALIEAHRKAEAASLSKSRFLATVSHEFRTPLNGILGLTGLLLETRLTPDQETYARGVRSSGETLLGLVDDILDFSKIEAGRLDLRLEATAIAPMLQEIAELLAAKAHGKGIDIAAETGPGLPVLVLADAARLRQVLLNLAGNGVKFTEQGGVLVAAQLESQDEDTVRVAFSVSDSGPGVPPGEAERIFGEFEQADSATTRRHGGTGLGLAISRRIVRRMGGDIRLEPRPGGGSVFSFAVDLAIEAPAEASEMSLAGRRVLILAPEGAEPGALARQLSADGVETRVTGTANEAAALAAAAAAAGLPYDAFVADRRAAGDDPAATLARLREGAGTTLPAAILIEPGKRAEVDVLRAAGFGAYLVRPVRRASLIRIVADLASAGAEFRIDPTDSRPQPEPPARQASRSLEILIAEDNEINALLARAVLEQMGHAVTVVKDGAAAIEAASETRFAAILMDLHMPVLDGLGAAKAIRAAEMAAGLPRSAIFALTADVLAETRAAAEAAGIDAVLGKPITPDRLRLLITDLPAGA